MMKSIYTLYTFRILENLSKDIRFLREQKSRESVKGLGLKWIGRNMVNENVVLRLGKIIPREFSYPKEKYFREQCNV